MEKGGVSFMHQQQQKVVQQYAKEKQKNKQKNKGRTFVQYCPAARHHSMEKGGVVALASCTNNKKGSTVVCEIKTEKKKLNKKNSTTRTSSIPLDKA